MPKAPYTETLTTLLELSKAARSREKFLKSLKGKFRYLGRGAFRKCYAACDGWVFKVRVTPDQCDIGGDYWTAEEMLDGSNTDEAEFYNHLKAGYKHLAKFVAPIHYHDLKWDNDVVFSPRANCLFDRPGKLDDEGLWSEPAKAQHDLISMTFEDSHSGNIGYKGNLHNPKARLWLIDANMNRPWQAEHDPDQESLAYRLEHANAKAKDVISLMKEYKSIA